ncbi:MAG: M28 family peptidase [Terriglobia bacterium]|jgi:hypothetical protein
MDPNTGLLLTNDVTLQLIHNSSGDLAHQYVSQLSMWSRVVGTDEYEKAAQWVEQKAREFGLDDVHIERFPSDGSLRYFNYVSERYWKVRSGELWMTSPFLLKLTSYAEQPVSLCRDSTSADVEAELVDIGSGTASTDYQQPVKGRIVLTSSDPAVIVQKAVYEEGAAGIVSYWSIPEWDRLNRLPGDYSDLIGWRYLPDPGQRKGTFAFMISGRQGHELQEMLRRGSSLKLRAKVDAELLPGTLDVVTAAIRGSEYPNQEILVTAHLDEIGADDNGSGSGSILEMARTLNQLIKSGGLPPPLRTIRFIWMPEFAGTFAWLSKHLNDPVRRIADLNYDEMGANLLTMNSVISVSYAPDSMPTFLNALMESILGFMNKYNDVSYPVEKQFHIISVNGTRDRLHGQMIPFEGGSDDELYDHVGIPATFYTDWPGIFYHSTKDTPDKLDPTQLHRGVFSGLAAMSTLAYADDKEAPELARLVFAYGLKRVGEAKQKALERILSSPANELPEAAQRADNLLHHVYEREQAAIRSCGIFARRADAQQEVEQSARVFVSDEDAGRQQIRQLAEATRTAPRVAPGGFQLSSAEREAAHLIPSRKPDQQLLGTDYVFEKLESDPTAHLDVIRKGLQQASDEMRSRGESDLRLLGFWDVPAYYADGKRSVLEIADAVAAEYTRLPVDLLVLYFRTFEQAGVMTIATK